MKLNFKEWNVVYEALTDTAKRIADNIKWQTEYESENDKESDTLKEYRAQQATLLSIIKRLEDAVI